MIPNKLLTARASLGMDAPFFGALAYRLHLEPSTKNDTGWTDGRAIGFNPDFVETCTHAELCGFLAHEVMHVAAGHPWRRDGRAPKRWNRACDYAINGTLVEAGFSLPAGALLDAQYTGRSAEWIYDRLPAEDGDGDRQGSGAGGENDGDVQDAPAPEDGGTSEAEAMEAVQQAASVARARGALPGAVERFAKEAVAPRIDWRAVLARFLQSAARNDYSWRAPSRRYMARGLYLPSLYSQEMGRIAVAVDVSGSVDETLLEQFSAELSAISRELQPEAIDVLYCDARIQRRETFERGEDVQLRACGGGGTDFRPVFEALEGEEPVALVYLTDLDGEFPAHEPGYPVLWGATRTYRGYLEAPWGETVRM